MHDTTPTRQSTPINVNHGASSLRGRGGIEIEALSPDIEAHLDIPVLLRDGCTKLRCNIYRPAGDAPCPVLVHCVPYGKDDTCHTRRCMPDHWVKQYRIMKQLLGGDIGDLRFSDATPWESCDPNTWCSRGYVVVACDSRGYGASDEAGIAGAAKASVLSQQEAEDYFDLVQWCAAQPWSTGKVGTIGVSYLGMSQWNLLARAQPPALRAACIWEAMVNPLHCFINQGGAGPNRFGRMWLRIMQHSCRGGPDRFAQDFAGALQELSEQANCVSPAGVFDSMNAPIESIDTSTTAVLVCGSWSDQGVHNPGTFVGWSRLLAKSAKSAQGAQGSDAVYLMTHGGGKWSGFYGWGVTHIARFLDHYLKGDVDCASPLGMPRVRLEVRQDEHTSHVRSETTWPPESMRPETISLDGSTVSGRRRARQEGNTVALRPSRGSWVSFDHRFDTDTELSGPMALHMHVSLNKPGDAIIAVQVDKFAGADGAMRRVRFAGSMGDPDGGVARGYMRLSHHVGHDEAASAVLEPCNRHERATPLAANECVPIHVAINPSSTLFRAGDVLRVTISTRETSRWPMMHHADIARVNRLQGACELRVHVGDRYPLQLSLPMTQSA